VSLSFSLIVAFHGRPSSLLIGLKVMFRSLEMMTVDVSVLDIISQLFA